MTIQELNLLKSYEPCPAGAAGAAWDAWDATAAAGAAARAAADAARAWQAAELRLHVSWNDIERLLAQGKGETK
jgi:hypothetical protein